MEIHTYRQKQEDVAVAQGQPKFTKNAAGRMKRPATSIVALTCTALTLSVGGTASSHAQQRVGGLEEVVVTATRREAGLQSIPSSIAAVTGEDLDDLGITDFKSVTESISGVTLDFPSSAINAAVYIRGVGTTGAATVQSVSVMVDGVYQIRQGLAFTELMDIERVEVLRGPQGTLFGKNSTSGAIRVFTADPDSGQFSGRVQGVAGNLDAGELRGLINIPIIEGAMAARVSAYTAKRDGFTDNVYLDEDTRNVDREGWRAKLLWDITDDLQIKFSAENHDQETDIDEGIAEYGPTALANAAAQGVTLPPVSIGKYAQNISGKTREEVERYIFNLNWSFAGHTLSTISAWEDNETYLFADRDETIAPGQFFGAFAAPSTENTGPMEVETHEIQFASDGDGSLFYLIGIYLQDESSQSITSIPPIFDGTTNIEVESQAVFGNVAYDFNDQWGASLGLRRDEDERSGSNEILGADHVETFEETTYSAKVTYQYDADRMFYFSHDKGFKSGGVNRGFSTCPRGGACLPESQATWDPETAYNYELGMKSQWLDNRLRLNGAIFLTKFEDFQVSENVPEAVTVVVTNAAEVEAKGVELELSAVVTDNLKVDGSLTWVKSEYKKYEGAPCSGSQDCVSQDLSGETLDHAPELSFNLGAEYRNGFGSLSGAEWFARADLIYTDEQNLYVYLTPETEEDAYALFNARLGLESPDRWKVTLWGKNLFDEEYRTAADTAGLGGLAEVPGLPRTYGITADWYF